MQFAKARARLPREPGHYKAGEVQGLLVYNQLSLVRLALACRVAGKSFSTSEADCA